jgi:alpha-D-xyloside xylohydrolase
MKVRIDKHTGVLSFLDLVDHLLLPESTQSRIMEPVNQLGVSGTSCAQSFELVPDEGIYGLGQHQQGAWNYRSDGAQGTVQVKLAQVNMEVAVPVITSSKGYMVLWDNCANTLTIGARKGGFPAC